MSSTPPPRDRETSSRETGDRETGEPAPAGLALVHEHGRSLQVHHAGVPLLRYVYRPWDVQLESPRPYFHPLRTLAGDLVSLYRPHDHVWHKGIALSLPNVGAPAGTENFWGGPTYLRGREYVQLPNNGAMRHAALTDLRHDPARVSVAERLEWVTQAGQVWFTEQRSWQVALASEQDAWVLCFTTRLTNVGDAEVVFGSPTTEGRDNAGYGGLFWRGPRSFTGGTVYGPDRTGGDDLMGVRAPWLGFTGRQDGSGREATLVFVESPHNLGHPTRWFVRSQMFACVCPSPFFDTEVPVAPGGSLSLAYAVVVADGDPGLAGAGKLADIGLSALDSLEVTEP